jgi:hypothetical protein
LSEFASNAPQGGKNGHRDGKFWASKKELVSGVIYNGGIEFV